MTIWQLAAAIIFACGMLAGMTLMSAYYWMPTRAVRKHRRRARWDKIMHRNKRDIVG